MTGEPNSDRKKGSDDRDESVDERLDRNLNEFLQELRVALPGVQVLFAFLLVVPFNERFADVTTFQRSIYFSTLLCALSASVCLIAPTVHHRIQFRQQDKERILVVANRLAIAGLIFLAAALSGAVLLITDIVYADSTATLASGAVVVVLVLIWFAIPLRRSLSHRSEGASGDEATS